MNKDTVTITIDGEDVEAQRDQTILEAADVAGIYIPRLCHHKDLLPGGHCRVCTVKVNGRPQSACTFPVNDGILIDNNTEELTALRRNLIEFLFVEGNHFCPTCEASGQCELQAMGYRLGLLAPQQPYLNETRALDASHDDEYLDRNRCILCGRCVRASAQLDHKHVFGFENRGIETRIAVDSPNGLADTDLAVADQVARICPTGCLRPKREGYSVPVGQRRYDKTPIGAEIEAKHAAAR
jgi:[NiFe] hydrogenase diaphorase moiety small subunit